MKHTVEVMIPEAEIKARIAELGRQITERYKDSGSDMVLVGLLRGSFMFMADLCREVQVSHEVDFMTASSYGSGMSTTRDVKILKDLDEDIRGKDVLIVEDIIDSGNTLSKVREILSLREPKSLVHINGQAFDMNKPMFAAAKGQYERWVISGVGDMMLHPFHIHGTQFRILSENGKPPAAHRAGWKDTVKVEGNVSEVLVKFNHDAPKEHAYMAHCHLLEHEDTGMMLGFTV